MFCREKTELYMPELYNKIGVGLMTWSPLTMGLVSGKLEDGGMPLFARASFKVRTDPSDGGQSVNGGLLVADDDMDNMFIDEIEDLVV
ncbi:unnamed protein product [Timema podura]|uniref:Uncharacterized protein n=1 Tax=Timema podura TaxID=61482 RepID=A0ABN7PSI8_TIMPD|nr:unnamed protein product [Timema podura]